MSAFWSGWIKFLVVLNLGITFFLFILAQRLKIPTQPDGTTGHVWAHGVLREGVRTLPLWWVVSSAAVFVWGFIYLSLYPGFGSSQGLLGWTSQGEWRRDLESNNAKLEARNQPLRQLSVAELAATKDASAMGHRLYLDNCAACHGSEARGNQALGAPNLTDNDWLYGGSADTILASILDGRGGVMPALGGALGQEGVNEVAAYVLSLSNTKAPTDWVEAGKVRFATLCAACHGADGRGNPAVGAPNLTDDTWLYGGDFTSVAATIRNGRNGVMPAWRGRLNEDQARAVAAWVYSQGHRGATE
jgi:cytochrome c oxidase cbb3-type subunit 3